MPSLSVSIACASGARVIPAAWIGRALAVHRPPTRGGGISRAPRLWIVSHAASGLSAGLVRARKSDAIALARVWDDAFADPEIMRSGSRWPLASQWGAAITAAGQTGVIFPPNPDAVDPIPAADDDGDALPLSLACVAASPAMLTRGGLKLCGAATGSRRRLTPTLIGGLLIASANLRTAGRSNRTRRIHGCDCCA